ncbi:MAG: hypothetical protein RIF36_12770 [Imperialibacter sp.]|uniref:hypothetical protein n=1 Tax=Imperialibacter sp. TaxID=2038411 RepID=UPI0032EB47C4
MNKYTVAFIALLFFLKNAHGQHLKEASINQVGVGVGYQHSYLKDDNFSPLNQAGGGLATSARYQRISKNVFGVNFQFSSGNIHSGPTSGFTTSFINANLELEYLFKLTPDENAFQFFLGPANSTRVLYLDWYDLEAFSYVATHGVGIKGMVSKHIKEKHLLQATLSLPVFQLLARPPYNGIDEFIIENQDSPANIIFSGTPSSLNDFFALGLCVDYKYKLTERVAWHTNYSLHMQTVMATNRFKSLSNTVTTGVAVNF